MAKGQSSKFRGVTWSRRHKRWQAGISLQGKFLYLGTYEDEADAARIWDLAALKSRGISAHTNFELSNYLDSSGDIIAVERLDQAINRHQAKRNLEPTVSPTEKALAVFLGAGAAAAAAAAVAAGCDDDGDDSDWSPDRPSKQRRTRAAKQKSVRPVAAPAHSNSMSSSSSGSSSSNPASLQVLVPNLEEAADTDSAAAVVAAAAAAARTAQGDHTGQSANPIPRQSTAAGSFAPAAAVSDVKVPAGSSAPHSTSRADEKAPAALPPAGFKRGASSSSAAATCHATSNSGSGSGGACLSPSLLLDPQQVADLQQLELLLLPHQLPQQQQQQQHFPPLGANLLPCGVPHFSNAHLMHDMQQPIMQQQQQQQQPVMGHDNFEETDLLLAQLLDLSPLQQQQQVQQQHLQQPLQQPPLYHHHQQQQQQQQRHSDMPGIFHMHTAAPISGTPQHYQQQPQQQFMQSQSLTAAPSYHPPSTGITGSRHGSSSSNSGSHCGSFGGDCGLLSALAIEVGNPGFSPVSVLRGSSGTFAVISYITRRPNSSGSSSWGQEPWRVDVWNSWTWQNIGLFPDQAAAAKAASYALALVVGSPH